MSDHALMLLRGPSRLTDRQVGAGLVALAAIVVTIGCQGVETATSSTTPPPTEQSWDEIQRTEASIRSLGPSLKTLRQAVLDLELVSEASQGVFAERVHVVDLDPSAPPHEVASVASLGVRRFERQLAPEATVERHALELWAPLFSYVDHFKHAGFKVLRGRRPPGDDSRFDTDAEFHGLARLSDGSLAQIGASLGLGWESGPAGEDGEESWRLVSWETRSFHVDEAPAPLFVEHVEHAVPDPQLRDRLRRSLHEEAQVAVLRGGKPPYSGFEGPSWARHPGLAVADVDADGRDDLYVMPRIGKSMLLRNRADGTFEEIAATIGLDQRFLTSALFADFDNDGDLDAFVGGSLRRSAYLVNEAGKYVDRSDSLIDGGLPYLTVSISAADYDRDGLLDVYFATYFHAKVDDTTRQPLTAFFTRLIGAEAAAELVQRAASTTNDWRDGAGPPNVLLRNLGGGRFGPAEASEDLKLWRPTYQATWADFDDDGDPDLYVANDYSPNHFLRNDGGRFHDVTADSETADLGFGMGATWGDYDNDGLDDLYVTNMYSKAGRRITSAAGEKAAAFAPMAKGNTLLRQTPDRGFVVVSGEKLPRLPVENGGWGWGAQFVDVNHDGWLDIYAPAGFYTAAREVRNVVDT